MNDQAYMQRALELAQLGRGYVSPNPMVGCVIVHNHKIIGEGYHTKYGEAHAEVNAINSIKDRDLLIESTVYVTLEPCAHYGKTPPCADLLINEKVKKVVIACEDPFEKVDGKGIQKLKNAGIEVEVGVLEKESKTLNERFFTFHKKNRPYVILKWAQTSDRFIARENFDSKWISNPYSRQLVHKWRTEEDAILVGKNTTLYDNPSLTSREWKSKNPIRILLDSQCEVPEAFTIFSEDAETIIFNSLKDDTRGTNTWIRLEQITPIAVLSALHKLNIQSVIIEGGSQTLNSFTKENCWDEARVFISKARFERGIEAPQIDGEVEHTEFIFDDQLIIYRNPHG